MNLDKIKNLNKEQKQQLVLVVMLVGGLLYALWEFGVYPILREKEKTEAKIQALQDQQRREQLLLNKAESTSKNYREMRDEIRRVMTEDLPPYDNAMSWATELLGTAAASAGMRETDLAISERSSGVPLVRTTAREAPPPLLNIFQVGVNFSADYHTLGKFIAAVERENPYVHVGLLTVKSQMRANQYSLEITLECAFPRFSQEAFPETVHPDAPLPAPPSPTDEEDE